MGTNTNTNTTLLTLRISATGTGAALPLGRQLEQDFQENIFCCYHLAIRNFLSSYLTDKPCKTIENIFAWKVLSNKQQKIRTSHGRWRKILSYVFFFCKRYFLNSLIDAEPHVQCQGKSYHNVVFLLPKIFKQPKEETSSSPMPDLTSKRVGVGELLAIAPSRRTSKFGDFFNCQNIRDHIGWLFVICNVMASPRTVGSTSWSSQLISLSLQDGFYLMGSMCSKYFLNSHSL